VIEAFGTAALQSDPVRVDWRDRQEWNELDPGLVTVPTLLLEGELDPLTRPDAHTRLFTRFGTPDRTWQIVPGGGHRAFLEAPRDVILAAVARFILRTSTETDTSRPSSPQTPAGDTQPKQQPSG
jgi:alpha-beta hydrolase superfamily lysophospholipase